MGRNLERIGGDFLNNLALKELMRSKEERHILTAKITGIENEYYKIRNESIPCAIVWYKDIKILIPSTHLRSSPINKAMLRGMLGAEIDFIIIDIDTTANIAIASRIDAMELRVEIELPKLKQNDTARVRVVAVGVKRIIVELYGKEVTIQAKNLKHTYITNCKELYRAGDYLKVRIKSINIEANQFELSAKDFEENPYKNIRKYIVETGEYTGQVIAFPKGNSGVIVQLDDSKITVLTRIPSKFRDYPHYMENVLIRVNEIKEDKCLIYGHLVRII